MSRGSASNTEKPAETQANPPESAAEPTSDGHETDTAKHGNRADPSPHALAEKTLAGDLRDAVWMWAQDHGLLLKKSELQQRRPGDALPNLAEGLAKATVHLVASRNFPTIIGLLKEGKIKDRAIEAKIIIPRHDENRHRLLDATGGEVVVLLADARQHLGTRGPIAVAPDQPELTLGQQIGELATEGKEIAVGMWHEARRIGREDGERGDRDHAAPYAAGTPGHADYELGHNEGREIREAREQEWAIRAAQAVEIHTMHPQEPPPRRRGRPLKNEARA